MKLRPYQIDAINRVNENLKAGKKVQYVLLPQGSGKTVIACNIIKTFSETGKKVLVLFTRVVEKEQFDSVVRTFNLHPDFVKTTTVQRLYHSNKNEAENNDDCYDLIISLSNNFLVNSLKIKEKNSEPSLFEKTVNEISSKNQAPIIYFETSPISENLDKIPLLSTDCTFYLSNEQFQREFNSSFISLSNIYKLGIKLLERKRYLIFGCQKILLQVRFILIINILINIIKVKFIVLVLYLFIFL